MKSELIHRDLLENLERELIHFVFERSWGFRWRGDQIPKDLFRSFAANAKRLSDGFTRDRKDLKGGGYLRTKEGRSAYLLYFHLANVMRSAAVLEEIHRRGLWRKKPMRVLDLGAGSSPSFWALALAVQRFGGEISELVALDGEKKMLDDAKLVWEKFRHGAGLACPPLRTIRADFYDPRTPPLLKRLKTFDLIFCSNLLNELKPMDPRRRTGLFDTIVRENLSEDGMLIVVEPALQETAKSLTLFRDELLSALKLQIPVPCGHTGACPLNREPRDWCHFEVEWDPPPVRRKIEYVLGHRSGSLKYAYFAACRGRENETAGRYRVISDRLKTKQGDLFLLCAPSQKLSVSANVLHHVNRGDLLEAHLDIEEGVHRYAKQARPKPGTSIRKM